VFGTVKAAIIGICAGAGLLVVTRAASPETLLERGAYLVNTIAGCGRCHTPRDAAHKPMADMELAGGFEFDDGVIGHVVGPNITPDRETGIGSWTEAEVVSALRNGKRPDGTIIGPPMPIAFYRNLSDRDAAAIAAYLHSLKPVSHAVPRTQYKIPLPSTYGPLVTHVDEPAREDPLAYNAYFAGPLGHCLGCHTPFGKNGELLDMSQPYAGGRELPDYCHPGAVTVGRNITSDPDDGLGKWSDDDIKRALTAGIRPDGTRLSCTMPFEWYARLIPTDLDALVAFVRTVKPLKTP
jgi:mono/diheme cytochrome c family protein